MKPLIKFYATILSYLQSEIEDDNLVKEIVALAKKATPSWETTEESLRFLEQCTNCSSSVEDDEHLFTTQTDFLKAAFRDLSVLKEEGAMEVFQELAKKVSATYDNGEDIFVWARTVKERPDGSGVVILHVTDIARFRVMIEKHDSVDHSTTDDTLEEGILIGS